MAWAFLFVVRVSQPSSTVRTNPRHFYCWFLRPIYSSFKLWRMCSTRLLLIFLNDLSPKEFLSPVMVAYYHEAVYPVLQSFSYRCPLCKCKIIRSNPYQLILLKLPFSIYRKPVFFLAGRNQQHLIVKAKRKEYAT